jgi:hypothetical protein
MAGNDHLRGPRQGHDRRAKTCPEHFRGTFAGLADPARHRPSREARRHRDRADAVQAFFDDRTSSSAA